METLELFFRFSAIGVFLAVIALCLRDMRETPEGRFFTLLSAGAIGFLATHASVEIPLPGVLFVPLSVLSKTAALFVWWFVFSLFVDGFRLGRVEIGFAAVWIALVPFDFDPLESWFPGVAGLATSARVVMATGLAVYIIARLVADRSIDLVEPRRRARLWLAGMIVAIFVVDLASDQLTGYGAPPLAYSTAQKGAILLMAVAMLLWTARAGPRAFAFQPERKPRPAASIDAALNARLQDALDAGLHLEADVSLPGLARRLGAPEHRLRKLINEGLGHRNFRSFLNARRVETAKALLADPQRSGDSITAIAFDAGFASLASFNRVFKDVAGETPSAFRARKGA